MASRQRSQGSKHFEAESQGNNVPISDTTDMTISARSTGSGYRFEARKGTESFVVREFAGAQPVGSLSTRFTALAQQMGALDISEA